MSMSPTVSMQSRGWARLLGLLLVELAAIHMARHIVGFQCDTTVLYARFCGAARDGLLASYSLAAVFVLLGLFARQTWVTLLSEADLRRAPLCVNVLGLIFLIATLPLLKTEQTALTLNLLALVWAVCVVMVVGGIVLMAAPLHRWRDFIAAFGWGLPLVASAGLAAPFLAYQMRLIWSIDALSDMTFWSVVWIMELWGQQVESLPENKVIGADGFFVNIAPSCSGVEGLVLTTTFVLIYLMLFRRELRFPHALMILPVALLASWLLNAVRIAVLVQIGISGHPELAVGAFHSHAGWLMFTILSLGIVMITQSLNLFHAAPATTAARAPLPPFFQDPVVAQILPFAIFMASALLASTFSTTPAVVYPLRALAMAAALWLVRAHLRALPWRLDPLALGVGAVIAAYWVVLGPDSAGDPVPLAGAGTMVFALWVLVRVIGTTLLVPVIEELFFRGYAMDRIAPQGAALWRVGLAVIITTAAFAALHDRWIAAAVAGLLFAGLTLRSRNLTDAIVAHGVANGLIAFWAVITGNWAVI